MREARVFHFKLLFALEKSGFIGYWSRAFLRVCVCVCSAHMISLPQKETKLFIGKRATNKQLGNTLPNIQKHVTFQPAQRSSGQTAGQPCLILSAHTCFCFLGDDNINCTDHYHLFSRILTSEY